jgi:predicted dehydrogenase
VCATVLKEIIMKKIGVGVIGASPMNPGWAIASHIPAIQALPDYELRAVSTSNRQSAEAASAVFDVPAFDNYKELVAFAGVDLVVVTVKVRYHYEMVVAALAAGKMVLSEWPLGKNLEEARDLTERAAASGLRTAIGLQGRFAPAIQHARRLIQDGYLGDVLATTLVGSGFAWGPETERAREYLFDAAEGASTLTVPTLHALDALNFMVGDFVDVGARLGKGRRWVHVKEDDRKVAVSAPDQIAIFGGLESGATASIFYRGGLSRGSNLHWEINGTEGDLVISSNMGNVQVADLRLSGGRGADTGTSSIDLPGLANDFGIAEVPGGNTLRLYAQLAADIRDGTNLTPDFARACYQHEVITAIEKASASGQVQSVARNGT